ncbi:uncharacterized protein KGF55_003122 [Candida pseudojiufengensis]|uniref:uncharacterized protein n=1 Tax=Candida pseudojiufengensis TaxID=497109 RepID=UPI002224A774|nr:uncharacterized protein KGF55_003122 [Candida pseudojiufengensis]KAI5963330.1 hypothetical protein KGF55_003122 [Candida pseudojiufengensis]
MYIPGIYASIITGILLFPFLIPIRTKNKLQRNIKTSLIILFIISILSSIAPETSQIGAPFHKYGKSKIAFYGCNYQIQLTQIKFCNEDNKTLEWCFCNNFNAFATIAHCYKIGHPNEINSLLTMCQEFNKTLSLNTFNHANDYYDSHAKSISELQNENQNNNVTHFPIKLNETETHIFEQAYDHFLGNFDLSVDYGAYLVLFWVVVFTLISINNWFKHLFPQFFKHMTDPLTNWFRSRISLPSTNNKNKTNEYKFAGLIDMLVPTRIESIILTSFTILTTYLMISNISYTEGDPLFHTKRNALLRYYAVRASILSSTMMPLLILFGGRNNFLQWITKWDYSTFITLHRWISRIIMILIIIHAFNYSAYMKSIKKTTIEPYLYWGTAAFLAGVVIMIQGLLVLRRKWYEMFLILHILLAGIFIFGAWLHVEELYCVWFYYVSSMIWLFDRIIRVLRLYQFGNPQAKIYLLSDDTLKIIVPKPKSWEVIPGGHAFIHFLKWDCFWQSHPFTYTSTNQEIILFIKVKKGVTKNLANYLKTHPDKYTTIRVAIEGSYGEQTPAYKYDSSVFIAGGNGIPGIYAEALDVIKSQQNQFKDNKVKLIWVVREYSSLFWFYEELIHLQNLNLETTIYITRPNLPINEEDFKRRIISVNSLGDSNELSPLLNQSSTQSQKLSSSSLIEIDNKFNSESIDYKSIIKKELQHISFTESRPNVNKIVETNIEESIGSTCFITCGHPIMVDEIRQSVVENIYNPEKKRVDYFEQLQVWA